MQHNHLCRYLFSIAFISIFAIPRAVFASQVTMSGADVDWMSIFAIIFIFLVIAGLVWLSFYVKKERANHVQVMIWMYSSVLDGKLRNLIINLQDSVELLCSDNFDNELLSVSQDSFWRLGDKRLRADFLDLAEKSSLGELQIQDINYGFECLEEAITYMKTLSDSRDGGWKCWHALKGNSSRICCWARYKLLKRSNARFARDRAGYTRHLSGSS